MNLNTLNLKKKIKIQLFIGVTLFLFILKLFFTSNTSLPFIILNELLVFLIAFSFVLNFIDFIHSKNINALSLVMNVGILNAILFFLINFSSDLLTELFGNVSKRVSNPSIIFNFISFFYSFIVLSSVSYIFLALREFFFLKQKRDVKTYFNTMVIFFILASLFSVTANYPKLQFIRNTFFIISILLIIINSIRISWIAFLTKKEKLILLFLSVVITVLFVVNLINSSEEAVHVQILKGFSNSLEQFTSIIMIYGAIYFSVIFFTTLFHIPTAEAFDRKAQEVSSLQYFSKLVTQVLDFNDLASTVTELALKAANGDSAWIALKDKEEELKIIANKNIGLIDTFSLSKYIIEKAEKTKPITASVINLEKYWKNVPPSKDVLQPEPNYSFALFSSLKAYNESIGYLIIVKKSNLIFDQEDITALNTFSDYASIAIENSKLLKESIEKERLEKELDVAREIQRKILPEKNPERDNLSIASVFIPAFEVGGDYYDFFEIDESHMGFIVADVSGKGISAAFIMAELKGIFESLSGSCTRDSGKQRSFASPKEILIQANEILKRTLERKNFVSAVYGIIDFQKEELHLARAGHCPILLMRENLIQNLRPTGIGLGLDFSERFKDSLEEIKINLQESDTIILYTDGITEAKNLQLQDFGDYYFEKILIESSDKGAEEISSRVIKEVT
ncbi:MAG: GAF domain-containing SpoIIE family protein phosphatase, partial [Ignavibacteria bacterium]